MTHHFDAGFNGQGFTLFEHWENDERDLPLHRTEAGWSPMTDPDAVSVTCLLSPTEKTKP